MPTSCPILKFEPVTNPQPEDSLVSEHLPRDNGIDSESNTGMYSDPDSVSKPVPMIKPPKYALVPPSKIRLDVFRLLQLWKGRVTDVSEDEFVSIISDLTNPALDDEQVTLDLEEVPVDDLPLVSPGAVFYWSIGYADYPGRPRTRESRIRFRRLPGWTEPELNRAERNADRLADLFARKD